MYAIYGNIYHQYTPFMLAYIPYMDPMGYDICIYIHYYTDVSAIFQFVMAPPSPFPKPALVFDKTRAEVKQLGALLQSIVGQGASGR